MRLRHYLFLGMLAFVFVSKGQTTNSFSIYLTADPIANRIVATGEGDWSCVRLSEAPVISASDIVSYNFGEHSMRLRTDAIAKLPRPPVQGTPFVVVADGQRVYLGAFTTCISSMGFPVPHIMLDRRMLVTNQPVDTLVIEKASPSPKVVSDLRRDVRIKAALAGLHKLKDRE